MVPLSLFKQTKIENWTDAMLWGIAVRVFCAQGSLLAACFLPNTQPRETHLAFQLHFVFTLPQQGESNIRVC